MRRMTGTFAALLAAGTMMNSAAMAADRTNQVATESPVETRTENPLFEYSARRMLGFVSEARVAADNKQKETALAYIDSAQQELNSIRNTRDYLDMAGIRFGRVLYGESGSYYIPIADDTYAVRTYAQGPFWSADKATAVRDVELVNVDIAVNPEKTSAHLDAARQKINSGDFKSADSELKGLLDESIRETTSMEQPFTRLQDNIYLTRILIRQENYDGARYTLKHAKSALGEYEKGVTDPQRLASVTTMRQEIDMLDGTIQRRDPTLMKKAGDKVEQWWDNLKTWTREKTQG